MERPRPGPYPLSTLLGATAYAADGSAVGKVEDLVVEVDTAGGAAAVTDVVVRGRDRGRHLFAPGGTGAPAPSSTRWVVGPQRSRSIGDLTRTEVLVKRDVLDAPVVVVNPHRRTRVSDVLLEIGPGGLVVSGLDLSRRTLARRLVRRARTDSVDVVPLSAVHLASGAGHAAQLAAPGALVHRLSPEELAEVLTRTSITHGREILQTADREVARRAAALLHPALRTRISGDEPPPRRMLRTQGWRLHRPHGKGHG